MGIIEKTVPNELSKHAKILIPISIFFHNDSLKAHSPLKKLTFFNDFHDVDKNLKCQL